MAAKHISYRYNIVIQGHLGGRWAKWFQEFTITPQPSGETLLTGIITDQAALHGVLNRIRDLGLELLSVQRCEPKTGDPQ